MRPTIQESPPLSCLKILVFLSASKGLTPTTALHVRPFFTVQGCRYQSLSPGYEQKVSQSLFYVLYLSFIATLKTLLGFPSSDFKPSRSLIDCIIGTIHYLKLINIFSLRSFDQPAFVIMFPVSCFPEGQFSLFLDLFFYPYTSILLFPMFALFPS